ncbi:hypothetical protein KOR42_23410 [Thalassoglobus neptunius]|uniref:Uncharacterized protein n=1 Tax=Thalassoglobus neptunius TaxID=1938619 RepID=A0A5C5X7R4_9PLAN|nr:hypothetical protein [Thalassoglobus neptunius]TWT58954.1 hypothetical protein KOR42_23410 [Thalassoglobus neptunius]
MARVYGGKRIASEKLNLRGGQKVWFCDGCGEAFTWDEFSSVFGSFLIEEKGDYHRLWIACSDECRGQRPEGFPKGVRKPKGPLVRCGLYGEFNDRSGF